MYVSETISGVHESFDPFLLIREGSFAVKNLLSDSERVQAHNLRHEIFCEELQWATRSGNFMEMDHYDESAIFFGVLDEQDRLIAHLRIIRPPAYYMIENDFASLVQPEHTIRKEDDTVEVSRLCVAPDARNSVITGSFGVYSTSMLLYKGLYHWCRKREVRFLYMVVEYKVFRLLSVQGFPCASIGEPTIMPDGVKAVAAIMDWREFERANAGKRPELLKWFSQGRSALSERQLPQSGPGLPHRVSA